MNADRFNYREIKDIILRRFKEKISVMISVDLWLSSYQLKHITKGIAGK